MSLVVLGLIVIGIIMYLVLFIMKVFGLVDYSWWWFTGPVLALLAIIILFSVGLGTLLFMLGQL